MKKFASILVAVIMLMSVAFANVNVPKFLTSDMDNYTADYDVSIIFDNSREVVEMFEELEMPEEVNYFVDLEMLLRTLLSYNGKMSVEVDMSDDYSKVQMALTADSNHVVSVNSNLNMGIDAKMGMWIDMDLSNSEAPVFDVIYQQPIFNKYMKITSADMLEQGKVLNMLKSVLNKEHIASMQEDCAELFIKHSTVRSLPSRYIFKMDNDGLIAYLNELMPMVYEMIPEAEDTIVLPDFTGLTLLGDEGITTEVVLSGGKIKTEKIEADISIDLSKIYSLISEMPWEYESNGKIDFTLSMNANVTKIGKTKVKFPVLTEDNSFSISDLAGDGYVEGAYPVEEAEPYPLWYVGEECDYLEILDGEVYVPLRQTLEAAYEDSISIAYDNDKITIACDYFEQFDEIIININSDKAVIDRKESKIMKPILRKDKTYVSSTFFTELFGWEFGYASHDLVDDYYQYTFYTDIY